MFFSFEKVLYYWFYTFVVNVFEAKYSENVSEVWSNVSLIRKGFFFSKMEMYTEVYSRHLKLSFVISRNFQYSSLPNFYLLRTGTRGNDVFTKFTWNEFYSLCQWIYKNYKRNKTVLNSVLNISQSRKCLFNYSTQWN